MRLRPDEECKVGIVIPATTTTPQWQLSECVQSILDAQNEDVRRARLVIPERPYLKAHIMLSSGPGLPMTVPLPAFPVGKAIFSMVNGPGGSFAENVNNGVVAALKAKCDPILLLNADTHIVAGQLEEWVAVLSTTDDLAICGCVSDQIGGPAMVSFPDDSQLVSAVKDAAALKSWSKKDGAVTTLLDQCWDLGRKALTKYPFHLQDAQDVKMVAAMIPAWAFEHVGFLDTRFRPGNREDVDWCWRARQAGYRTAFNHGIFIQHYGSQSFADRKAWDRAMKNNRDRFNAKWSGTTRFKVTERPTDFLTHPDTILRSMGLEEPYSLDPLLWHADLVSGTHPREAIRDLTGYLGLHQRDPQALWCLVECLNRVGRKKDAEDVIVDMLCWFPLHRGQIIGLSETISEKQEDHR